MKKHILLIDDDKDELKIFLDAMEEVQGDFKCTYAENTQQAIEMLKYLEPDFIFVDFNIPKLNGLQFLSVVKAEKRLNGSRVFLYSTNISDEINQKAQVLGAAGSIEKTNTISMLATELKEIFSGEPEEYMLFRGK